VRSINKRKKEDLKKTRKIGKGWESKKGKQGGKGETDARKNMRKKR
jgi:hypothetical protein